MTTYAQKAIGREYSKFCEYVVYKIMVSDENISFHSISDKLSAYWERNHQKRGVYNEEVFSDFIRDEYMFELFNNGQYHDWGDGWNMYYLLGQIFEDVEEYDYEIDRIIKAIKEQDEQFLFSLLAININIDDIYELVGIDLWERIAEGQDSESEEEEEEEEEKKEKEEPPQVYKEHNDEYVTDGCILIHKDLLSKGDIVEKKEEEPLPLDEQYKELMWDKDYQKWLCFNHSKVHPWIRKEKDRVYTLKPVIVEPAPTKVPWWHDEWNQAVESFNPPPPKGWLEQFKQKQSELPKPKAGTPEYGRWYRENKLTPEKKAEYKARSKAKEKDFRDVVRAEFFRTLEVE